MIKEGIIHCHSEYSMLDSPMTVKELVETAKTKGCPAIALTDHGNMLAMPGFFELCKKEGIKPIAGIEAYVEEENEGRKHLVILVKDKIGYEALCKAVTLSNTRIYTDKFGASYPRMNKEILLSCFGPGSIGYRHVVFSSACISGPLGFELLYNKRLRGMIKKIEAAQQHYLSPNAPQVKKLEKNLSDLEEKIHILEEKKEIFEKLCKKSNVMECKNKLKAYNKSRKEFTAKYTKYERQIAKYLECEGKIKSIRRQYRNDNYQKAFEEAVFYKGLGDFYIELQYHRMEDEVIVMPQLLKIAKELEIPVIATNDAHFAKKTDAEVRQYLKTIRFKSWHDQSPEEYELYIKDDEELLKILSEILPEETVINALDNIKCIVSSCDFNYDNSDHYPLYKGNQTFDQVIEDGIRMRMACSHMEWDKKHIDRLNYEKSVIEKMGFCDYFLIVSEMLQYAKAIGNIPYDKINDIPDEESKAIEFAKKFPKGVGVGPGRGSAVGSLVSYLMGITQIDPLDYNLVFERFLNIERVTMPDIDSDFRPEIIPTVIHHLENKYGALAVSRISTIQRNGFKKSLQSAGIILSSKYGNNEYKLAAAKLSKMYDDFPDGLTEGLEPEVLSVAKRINGLANSKGIHAAGIIVSDADSMWKYFPTLYNEKNECWAAQCDMVEAESHGLLKMDLLKLETLSICNECMQYTQYNIDWDNIPFEKEVFENIYKKGNLNCIFQCESENMQKAIQNFEPDNIEDLILMIAAYRPGPMDYLPDIIKVKKGIKKPKYLTDKLIPILEVTYGSIIYQEQVMQIFRDLAGYSMGDADLVRRAMSKKVLAKLLVEKDAFIYGDEDRRITGCIKNGISEASAEAIFDEMIDFAKYAFNKSHAVAYAILSYRTAYLKYHYPLEYLTAYINYHPSEINKVWHDCVRLGIEIEKPEINTSNARCRMHEGNILLGLSHIDQIAKFGEAIQQNRINGGYFTSRQNFIDRTNPKKNILENLDKAETFRFMPDQIPIENSVLNEKKLFGMFLSRDFTEMLVRHSTDFDSTIENKNARIAGMILSVEPFTTQKQKNLFLIMLGTLSGQQKIVFTEKVFQEYSELVKEGFCVIIAGAYSRSKFGFGFFARSVSKITQDIYLIQDKDFNESFIQDNLSEYGGRLLKINDDYTLVDTGYRLKGEVAFLPQIKIMPSI